MIIKSLHALCAAIWSAWWISSNRKTKTSASSGTDEEESELVFLLQDYVMRVDDIEHEKISKEIKKQKRESDLESAGETLMQSQPRLSRGSNTRDFMDNMNKWPKHFENRWSCLGAIHSLEVVNLKLRLAEMSDLHERFEGPNVEASSRKFE